MSTAAAAALLLAMTGCAGGGPTATPLASSTSSAGGSPAASATPAPSAPAATPSASPSAPATGDASAPDPAHPGGWVIDFTGIGPMTLGTPIADLEKTLPEFTSCRPGVDIFFGGSLPVSADPDFEIALVVLAHELDHGETPRTAQGITIGSTLDELKAAYPDLVATPKSFNDQIDYSITDGQTWIHFDTYGKDTVQSIYVWNNAGPLKEYCG